MLIGIDGSRAFGKDKTGTENYSYQLLKHLAKIDQKNTYLIYLRPVYVIPAEAGIQNKKHGSRIESGMTVKGWPDNFHFKVLYYNRLWTQAGLALQTFKDKLDILFVPSHTLPIIRNPKLKTVITVHDLGAEYLPKMHQIKQQLYLKYMTHRQLKGATKIIAVSNATKEDLIKKAKIDPNKIEVIYEGVGDEFKIQNSKFKIDVQRDILKRLGLKKDQYFLFVGTIQPRKNLVRLIQAFSFMVNRKSENIKSDKRYTINDLRLILVGSKGWLSEKIYGLPKKLGIEDNVKFVGRVEDKDLAALYSGAVALVFPSLFEGFGLPILEAMSCGCPVITSNISSMPEVAGNAAVLVDPIKVEEIAEAMEKLAQDNKLRDNLREKGFKQVEKFSWEKAARETLKVFQEVMSDESAHYPSHITHNNEN